MCLVVFAVSVGLIWDSESPDAEHIADVLQCIGTTLQLSDVSLPLPTTGGSVQTLGAYLYDFGAKKVKMLQTHKVWPALWILFAKH